MIQFLQLFNYSCSWQIANDKLIQVTKERSSMNNMNNKNSWLRIENKNMWDEEKDTEKVIIIHL